MFDNLKVFVVLNYHSIDPGFSLSGNWIPVSLFRRHLSVLRELGFKSPLSNIFDSGIHKYPPDEKIVLITFDDGFESVYRHAFPIMEEFGFKGIIFVVTGFIGKKSDWDIAFVRRRHVTESQIRELFENGWVIGSHSVTHPDLTRLDRKDLFYELRKSKETLEDITGSEVFCFSYPFGRVNSKVKEALRETGYRWGFRSRRSFNDGFKDPLRISRISLYPIDYDIKRKLDGSFPCQALEISKENAIGLFSSLSALVRHKLLGYKLF